MSTLALLALVVLPEHEWCTAREVAAMLGVRSATQTLESLHAQQLVDRAEVGDSGYHLYRINAAGLDQVAEERARRAVA